MLKVLKEFEYFDGETFITLDIVEKTKDKVLIVVSNRGKITLSTYELSEDNFGEFILFGATEERIYIEDFKEIEEDD